MVRQLRHRQRKGRQQSRRTYYHRATSRLHSHVTLAQRDNRGFVEDAWLLGSLPTDSDYSAIGAYLWRDSVLQLATAWYPYRFLQTIRTMNGALVYLAKCDKASGGGG